MNNRIDLTQQQISEIQRQQIEIDHSFDLINHEDCLLKKGDAIRTGKFKKLKNGQAYLFYFFGGRKQVGYYFKNSHDEDLFYMRGSLLNASYPMKYAHIKSLLIVTGYIITITEETDTWEIYELGKGNRIELSGRVDEKKIIDEKLYFIILKDKQQIIRIVKRIDQYKVIVYGNNKADILYLNEAAAFHRVERIFNKFKQVSI